MNDATSGQRTAAAYLRENFEPGDRLAVVVLYKRPGAVIQRIASAATVQAPDFQAWLRQKNAHGFDVCFHELLAAGCQRANEG
jgi:hypothetical protein